MIRTYYSPALLLWGFLFFIHSANAQTRYWHYYNEELKEDAFFFQSYERGDVLLLKIGERSSGNHKKYGSPYRKASSALLTGYRSGDSNFSMQGVELVDTTFNHTMYRYKYTVVTLGDALPYPSKILAADTGRSVTVSGFGSPDLQLNKWGYDEAYRLIETRNEYYCMGFEYEIQPSEFCATGLNRLGTVNVWSDNAVEAFGTTIVTCLRSGNKKLLAEHCTFPLLVTRYFPHSHKKKLRIRTKNEFIRNYASIFTPEFIRLVDQAYTSGQSYFINPAPGRPDRFMEIFSSSKQLMSVQCENGRLRICRIFN